jgi:DNA replication licensing factor MCM3
MVLILASGTPPPDNLSQPLAVDNPSHAANAVTQETNPFEKYDPLLHAGVTMNTSRRSKKSKMEVLSLVFVKKYIQYAKARPAPVLTKGAADWIVSVYSGLRNDEIDANNRRVGFSITGSARSIFLRGD